MNNKVLIGIIAAILVVVVAVVGIVSSGDKDEKKQEKSEKSSSGVEENIDDLDRETVADVCFANRRLITSQLNMSIVCETVSFRDGDTYELRTNKEGNDGEWVYTGPNNNDQTEIISRLFNEPPFCPLKGSVIKITIKETGTGDINGLSFVIETECCGDEDHR